MREESERLGIQEVRSFVFVKTLALCTSIHTYIHVYCSLTLNKMRPKCFHFSNMHTCRKVVHLRIGSSACHQSVW